MLDNLRTAVIKLAQTQPTLRKPLLSILREAAKSPPRDTRKWSKVPNDPWSYTWTDGKTTFTIKRRDQRGNLYYVLGVSSMEKHTDGGLILEGPHEVKGLSENVDYLAADAARLHGKIQAAVNGEDVTFEHLIPRKVATADPVAPLRQASSDPSDISSWSYTAQTTVYEWSDGRTKFEIKRRDMRGIIYYVLLVASNETFLDGTPILKTTFQHKGQKGVAEGWSKEVKALYRLIQAAVNGEGSVLLINLIPITSPNDLIKIR